MIAALGVDRADPVAVAVEGDAEIELLLGHRVLQVMQVLGLGRIGMVVRERCRRSSSNRILWVPGRTFTRRAMISPRRPLPASQPTFSLEMSAPSKAATSFFT
jgi:hypothetical protein